jgi:hypothetical protein
MNHTNLFHFFKKGLPLFSLLSLALSLWSCDPISSKPSELIDWIPQNSSWVIQINDGNTLTSELTNNEVFKEIKLLNKGLTADISGLLSGTPDIESLLCVTKVGKNPGALTHIYKAPLDSTLMNGPSIEYSKVQINIEKRATKVLYSTNISGYTLRSTSQLLIENCIRTTQQNSTSNTTKLFKTIYTTLDTGAPINILVQPKVEELIETMIGQTPLMPKVSHDWNAYDLNFEEAGFSLDGLVAIQDSLGDPLGILKENEAHKILLDQLTPDSSSSFLSIPLNNALETEDAFKQWVLHHNVPLAQINLKALSTVDEIGWIQLGSERILLFHSQNEVQAQEQLLPKLENAKQYREVTYYPTELPNDLLVFAEAIGGKTIPSWGTVIENFFVFATSEEAIKTVISSYKDGSTLSKNLVYNAFKENLASKSSVYWIAQTKALIDLWKKKEEDKNPWSKLDTESYPFIAFQGVLENDFMHLHFRIHKNDLEVKQNDVSNQYLLQTESPLSAAPQWLKNHRTKGMDVLVQDVNNKLYLFSDKGNLYWKKQLPGQIQGTVQQIDLYKNKRLQMAFRTEDKFFVLDRNGKIVKPFSIKIPATEPIQQLAVFDYDQRRNYRFVLAQGKNVRMYDNKGKRVSGFTFKKTKTPIINPPVHIRIDKKDYIAVQEESGKLNLLNRVGKSRIKAKESIPFSGTPVSSYLKTFTTSDTEGNLVQVDTKGNVIKTPLGLVSDHTIATTTKSLVTLSENILTIKGIPITLPYGRFTAPKIFYINNIIYVTTTDLDAQKVYLYFSNGTAVSGFPVYGTSAADLANADSDKAIELVVQSESNGMLIYEIN